MECGGAMGRRAVLRFPEACGRGHHGEVRVTALCGQLLDQHRHADCVACADPAHTHVRRRGAAAEIRLPDEAAYADQARLQESEAYRRNQCDERISRWLLGEPGLQLVRRVLMCISPLSAQQSFTEHPCLSA